jgi:hypothetical protein
MQTGRRKRAKNEDEGVAHPKTFFERVVGRAASFLVFSSGSKDYGRSFSVGDRERQAFDCPVF